MCSAKYLKSKEKKTSCYGTPVEKHCSSRAFKPLFKFHHPRSNAAKIAFDKSIVQDLSPFVPENEWGETMLKEEKLVRILQKKKTIFLLNVYSLAALFYLRTYYQRFFIFAFYIKRSIFLCFFSKKCTFFFWSFYLRDACITSLYIPQRFCYFNAIWWLYYVYPQYIHHKHQK